jgi:hypothetical protein
MGLVDAWGATVDASKSNCAMIKVLSKVKVRTD